jgi:hypothetical protein
MKALYIAWQDPETKLWHTVGELRKQNQFYCFSYTQGALASPNFTFLGRMRDLYQHYISDTLFPLFANRVLSNSRPEYPNYVRWLALDPQTQPDAMQLLSRSGGFRATDDLCVYPSPEINENDEIELFFFSHGLRYLAPENLLQLNQLESGTPLSFDTEKDNTKDPFALNIKTNQLTKVGYCPRYLNQDFHKLLNKTEIKLSVERLNTDAPIQFRLLCRAAFKLPNGFQLFNNSEYLPLTKNANAIAA